MQKEKTRKILNLAIFSLSTIALGLLIYMLCYICFSLYNSDCREAFAAILVGIILTGAISGLFYTIVVIWEEIKD